MIYMIQIWMLILARLVNWSMTCTRAHVENSIVRWQTNYEAEDLIINLSTSVILKA